MSVVSRLKLGFSDLHQSATKLKPLQSEVDVNYHLVTMQWFAGTCWVTDPALPHTTKTYLKSHHLDI